MRCDVVLLPTDLKPHHLDGRCVAVFDVLRATTTITAALAAGVRHVHLFGTLDEARAAAAAAGRKKLTPLLCGEERCLKPSGFDLGNSPGQFTTEHAQRDLLLCTTNGTRALIASRRAQILLVGALVNASSVARRVVQSKLDATMVCAGTNGSVAMEDVLGAGAVLDALTHLNDVTLESDVAIMSLDLFRASQSRLAAALRTTRGGINVLQAYLDADVDFAARLDALSVVGVATGDPLAVRADAS